MSKAAEKELSELHGIVARVLRSQLEDTIVVSEDGETKELPTASPAVIAQAIKFLKDNDITATVEDDENLSALEEALKAKREKRRLRVVGEE